MIITFYSYKGGVGRTQLVANLASYFCYYEKKRVLLIDWDLEAPGLHFYYDKSNLDINTKGLIDVFQQYVKIRRSGTHVKNKRELPKFSAENIIKLDNASTENSGCIDLIPAGNYAEIENYRFNVIDFNWYEFYELLDGKRYIEFIKQELKSLNYDYIFVDSRTGLSDYSDICNIQIPDMNIVVMAPTSQNMEGCRALVDNVLNSPYTKNGKFRKPIILPILSRLDLSIENQSNKWIDKFHRFNDLLEIAKPYYFSEISDLYFNEYIFQTLLDYKRDLSYGEQILFSNNLNERTYSGTLKDKYLSIAQYIKYFNISTLTELKKEIKHNLTNNEILEAIKILILLYSGRQGLDSIILLSASFHKAKQDFAAGFITLSQHNRVISQITYSVLRISEFIENRIYNIDFSQELENELKIPYGNSTKKGEIEDSLEKAKNTLIEWVKNLEASKTPSERKRSEIEIDRIQKLIELYETELNNTDNKE